MAKGGAIAALSDGVLRIADSVFDSNRAAVCPPYDSGGAGSRSGSSAQPRQQLQCGSGSGGAIALQRSGAWLDRVVFENNVAEAGGQGGGSLGGAVSYQQRLHAPALPFFHSLILCRFILAIFLHHPRFLFLSCSF